MGVKTGLPRADEPLKIKEKKMSPLRFERIALGGFALLAVGVSPNLYPAAQAGLAKLSFLGAWVLLPSIVLLILVTTVSNLRGHRELTRRILMGGLSGLLATMGLEFVRATSFHFGGMPGDMPKLLGVLLTDRFMLGPSTLSNILGYSYHFWNGVCFGIIFVVLFGKRSMLWAVVYAQLVGIGFLLSPAVQALGIGFMAMEMPAMPITVVLAHLVFGLLLGVFSRKWVVGEAWLLAEKF